jgi:hypothetical protein
MQIADVVRARADFPVHGPEPIDGCPIPSNFRAVYDAACFSFCSKFITTSTTLRKPSISSSTVPPKPAPAKLIELPTYTGLPVLRASSLDKRVVKSSVLPWVNSGVLSVSLGEAVCEC